MVQETVPELDDHLLHLPGRVRLGEPKPGGQERARPAAASRWPTTCAPPWRTLPGCEITVSASDMTALMGGGSDISVDITGTDYDTLTMIAEDLEEQIAQLEDAVDVTTSAAKQVDQVTVTMNREAASQYGLTAATIGAAVRSELSGATATTVTIDNQELDVVVRGDGTAGREPGRSALHARHHRLRRHGAAVLGGSGGYRARPPRPSPV